MQAAVLTARNLRVERGERVVFDDLALSAGSGSITHLSGRNGSGKTTLLRTLAGLITPDAGSVSWRGTALATSAGFRGELNFIGHQPSLNAELSGYENLRFIAALIGDGRTRDIDSALARLDADSFAERPVRQLSAGQRQRLSLARLALFEATLWMLDEPFTALDQATRRSVEALIDAHADAGGITLIATHQGFTLRHPVHTIALGEVGA